jgi:hypothetical protein
LIGYCPEFVGGGRSRDGGKSYFLEKISPNLAADFADNDSRVASIGPAYN